MSHIKRAGAVALLFAPPLFAAGIPANDIEEIVVTAQRRGLINPRPSQVRLSVNFLFPAGGCCYTHRRRSVFSLLTSGAAPTEHDKNGRWIFKRCRSWRSRWPERSARESADPADRRRSG